MTRGGHALGGWTCGVGFASSSPEMCRKRKLLFLASPVGVATAGTFLGSSVELFVPACPCLRGEAALTIKRRREMILPGDLLGRPPLTKQWLGHLGTALLQEESGMGIRHHCKAEIHRSAGWGKL